MKQSDLIEKISNGEDSYTQFKENITNTDKLAEELVAFSNAKGGLLILGVKDDSSIKGLSDNDIRRLNQLIGNVINANVTPPVYPLTTIEKINNKKLLVIEIDEGSNKPYSTNKGFYLTKAGSDKRKISPEELRRLFAQSKKLFADEELVNGSDISDLNSEQFLRFLKQDNKLVYDELKINKLSLDVVLENLELLRDAQLTLAGNLIFGLDPQRFRPSFYVDCVFFDGNDVSVDRYVSKKVVKGSFEKLFNDSLSFIIGHLIRRQIDENFNSSGELEVDTYIDVSLSSVVEIGNSVANNQQDSSGDNFKSRLNFGP